MNDYQALIHLATRLPELSLTVINNNDDVDPIMILHNRFDRVLEKLEKIERQCSSLTYRPSYIIPVTGAVTGIVKYCRQLKKRRDSQEIINHRCYIQAYQYVYDRLRAIAEHARKLERMELAENSIVTND